MSGAAHEHGAEHHPFLAHHFENHEQQFRSGKLGMWAFLAQEVLFFSALFVAYSVYRANHPEIFIYAHHFLDVNLGALNTVVLLFSSFTIAWAVRAAQLGQRKLLVGLLAITWLCAATFMVVKYVEYTHKFHEGLVWGTNYKPQIEKMHGESGEHGAATVPMVQLDGKWVVAEPANVQIFFGIYFAMTGLHGLHVLIGMLVILWLIRRSWKGHFDAEYYGPVEFVALYWHLVDLVWIYLFPLLYLIH